MCEDAPCCGCCPEVLSVEPPEDHADICCDCPDCNGECEDCEDDGDLDDSMDGDHASALASAGFGTDEDYGDWGGGDDGF